MVRSETSEGVRRVFGNGLRPDHIKMFPDLEHLGLAMQGVDACELSEAGSRTKAHVLRGLHL